MFLLEPRLAVAVLAFTCAMALICPRVVLALDPAEYDSRVRGLGLWIMRSADPSSLHPASPIGVMPVEVPEGFPIPVEYGYSATYGFSQFTPTPVVLETLGTLLPSGVSVPDRYRLNRAWVGLGLSRRTTLGAHFVDYPAFAAWGGGMSIDHTFIDLKPLFFCSRLSSSYVSGGDLWKYLGFLGEFQAGLHFTGIDVFAGIGTRLARLDLQISGDSDNRHQYVNPFQSDTWETHAGAEFFLTKYFAVGGGLHWHPDGKGFGIKLIYKSRGTAPMLDEFFDPRQE